MNAFFRILTCNRCKVLSKLLCLNAAVLSLASCQTTQLRPAASSSSRLSKMPPDQQLLTRVEKILDNKTLRVSDYVPSEATAKPNVGVCISGGGSRSMVAGMGQLRGLNFLKNSQGNLLTQVKAISTVSGGSWIGTTFAYLPGQYPDKTFLGEYLSPSQYTPDNIQVLQNDNIGARITKGFSAVDLVVQAALLMFSGNRAGDIWRTLIGVHLLEYYGLYQRDLDLRDKGKSCFFSYDQTSASKIIKDNPQLASAKIDFVKQNRPEGISRPYPICNMSMFVNLLDEKGSFDYLVPVQATPFFTGVISSPSALTAESQQAVGGGWVSSFSFNSDLKAVHGDSANVMQQRQFALVDAESTSSVSYAEAIQNLGAKWQEDIKDFMDKVTPTVVENAINKLGDLIPAQKSQQFKKLIDESRSSYLSENQQSGAIVKIKSLLGSLNNALLPRYKYWSVNETQQLVTNPTPFADGGNLENTGVNAMLAYGDIDRIIAFVNSANPLEQGDYGMIDENGQQILGTNVIVSNQIASLFGYQPYDPQKGYERYAQTDDPTSLRYRYNQVFPSQDFATLLKGLWEASGNQQSAGSNQRPAIYKQALTTVSNAWFQVKPGKKVTLLWVYNNFVNDWYQQLSPDVQKEVFNNDPQNYYNFPWYSTLSTELDTKQIHMLAGLSSWNIVEGAPNLFLSMFEPNE